MPKDETAGIEDALELDAESADDADDDVVDLLEVVKPGKAPAPAGGDDVDFSADLESMLDSLSQAEKAHDDAGADGAFPDPTPVDHEVDHNESLDLPGMDDLDAILDSLGAAAPDTSDAADTQGNGSPADDFLDEELGLEDLDAVPAMSAAGKSPAASDADYLDALLAEAENGDAAGLADAPTDALADDGRPADPGAEALQPDAPGPDGLEPDMPGQDAFSGATAPSGTAPARDADDLLAELGLDEEFLTAAPDPSAGMEFAVDDAPLPDPDAPETMAALSDEELELLQAAGEDNKEAGEDAAPLEAEDDADDLALSLDTATGDIASEALDMTGGPDGADSPNSTAIAAAPDGGGPEETEEAGSGPETAATPEDTTLPEPAMEDAPLDNTLPPDLADDFDAAAAPDGADSTDAPLDADSPDDAMHDPMDTADTADAPDTTDGSAVELPDAGAAASRFDEVDLNELDALLDDMLASAPAPGPGPALAAQAEGAGEEMETPETNGDAAEDGDGLIEGLGAGLAALRLDVEGLREQFAALAEGGMQEGSAPVLEDVSSTLESHAASLSAQAARLEELEERLAEKDVPGQTDQKGEEAGFSPELEDRLRYLDGQILSLETRLEEEAAGHGLKNSLAGLDERMDRIESRLDSLESRFTEFSSNLDKIAAEAAAKVIREEITALMSEGGL